MSAVEFNDVAHKYTWVRYDESPTYVLVKKKRKGKYHEVWEPLLKKSYHKCKIIGYKIPKYEQKTEDNTKYNYLSTVRSSKENMINQLQMLQERAFKNKEDKA